VITIDRNSHLLLLEIPGLLPSIVAALFVYPLAASVPRRFGSPSGGRPEALLPVKAGSAYVSIVESSAMRASIWASRSASSARSFVNLAFSRRTVPISSRCG
jgi:hypothetical protein